MKHLELAKFLPEVISPDIIADNMLQSFIAVRKLATMTAEERERELYESLKQKYEKS